MKVLETISQMIAVLFLICYSYQMVYIPIVFLKKRKGAPQAAKDKSYAFLICARNEEAVIADLIRSIQTQDYPQDLLHIFVLADNCTDATAAVAERAGAKVYERYNRKEIGKGYALNSLLNHLSEDYAEGFDGYFIFDADNILKEDYVSHMNDHLSAGERIVTSYRNSKNYAANWISAGYGLWFLRESRLIQYARYLLNSSASVSGTGFLICREVMEKMQGWKYHTLTEDIEFSVDSMLQKEKIGMCMEAEFFDEQPTTFVQSYHQRLRWSKGYLQVFEKYGKQLLAEAMKGDYACYDMSMYIMPAFLLSFASVVCNLLLMLYRVAEGEALTVALMPLIATLANAYLLLWILGAISTLTEWNHIHAVWQKKVKYIFTFPLFMFTYLPISVAALYCKAEWKPICHKVTMESMQKNWKEALK